METSTSIVAMDLQGTEVLTTENKLESENIEITLKEISRVQELIKTQLPLDQLTIEYSNESDAGWGAGGCYVIDHKRWGFISAGTPPYPEAKFLSVPQSTENLSILDHELTHLGIRELASSVTYPINSILSEGVSIAVEINSANAHLSGDKKINPTEIATHCQRIVEQNQARFLNPETAVTNPNLYKDKDNVYKLAVENPNNTEYDGFRYKRDLVHIAGISFVQNVIGDELWKWPVLFKNPPTMEEIIQPQKYIGRVGRELEDFQAEEVTPTQPILNPKVRII